MGNLSFSKDTVYLDTLFSNIGSSTYTLKVYNRSNEDIEIPTIALEKGTGSGFRLNVDGRAGQAFTGVPLHAKDSLFVFIEVTYGLSDTNGSQFLLTDAIHFDQGENLQKVTLISLIRDAVFLYPEKDPNGNKKQIIVGTDDNGGPIQVPGFELAPEELALTNEKPYVIYGYAAVPEESTLIVDKGARLYFHNNSALYVGPNSSLRVQGGVSGDSLLLENQVIFEGDRLEPAYSDVPGQWDGVFIAAGSSGNLIDHLTIKNAVTGLTVFGDPLLQTPTLTIGNTQIYNSTYYNFYAVSAFVVGENCVFGNSGASSLFCSSGGDYTFIHSTIANYWSNSLRQGSALQIDNSGTENASNAHQSDLIRADFKNCIVYGNGKKEIKLSNTGSGTFTYFFKNCLIQFAGDDGENQAPYNFGDPLFYQGNYFNEEVHFTSPSSNDFRLLPHRSP